MVFCTPWVPLGLGLSRRAYVHWSNHAASPHLQMLTDWSKDVIILNHIHTHITYIILQTHNLICAMRVRMLVRSHSDFSHSDFSATNLPRLSAVKMPPTWCAPCLRQKHGTTRWFQGGKAEALWAAKVHDGSLVGPIIKMQPWNLKNPKPQHRG